MAIKIKNVEGTPFEILYKLPGDIDFIIAIGGRGGRKTWEVSKFAAFSSTIKRKRVGVLRDEKETIRESILNEIFSRYDTANKYGHLDRTFEKLETGIRDKSSGKMVVFTKGFRASSNEKRSNLKGVSDVDIAIIEEAEDIRSFEKFNTFKDSVRTQERLIVVILNTPDIQHWIVKRYFNLEPITMADVPECVHLRESDLDGYWKLIPKKIAGFHCIQTSFEDNPFLPDAVVRDYKAYGDINSPTYDLHYYLTAIKGFASSGRKGQVLKKVKAIKLRDYLELSMREITGLDFGTASPAGIVGVKIEGSNLYAVQKNYVGMDTKSIGKFFCEKEYGSNDLIIADSAEPTSIAKLRNGWPVHELNADEYEKYPALTKGFFVRSARKGPGSIEAGVSLLQSMNLYFVEESADLWNEVYNYIYATNKEGEYTNTPIDDFNHLIDPIRYVAQARGMWY